MMKILVTEDDKLLSSILVRSLINAGFDTHASFDGFEAEIETKSWHPDLVILDLLMPNEDGISYLRKIRADSETHDTKVIVISNLSEPETIAEVRKFGVTEYIVKADTNPGEIIKKIQALFP